MKSSLPVSGLKSATKKRLLVGCINFHFFASTQSFIYFYLSRLRKFEPVCLTRSPESAALTSELPTELAQHYHLFGATGGQFSFHILQRMWSKIL